MGFKKTEFEVHKFAFIFRFQHTQYSNIPLFHHSAWLKKNMATKSTIVQ